MMDKTEDVTKVTKRRLEFSWLYFWEILGGLVVISIIAGVVCLVIWRVFWVTFVDNYELGFVYNVLDGKIEVVSRTGYITRFPLVNRVHTIDLRPYQIQITANSRVLNAKLLKFNPEGLNTFIAWHGRDAADKTANMLEILKCYAFDRADGKDCPFLTVVSEIAPNQAPQVNK